MSTKLTVCVTFHTAADSSVEHSLSRNRSLEKFRVIDWNCPSRVDGCCQVKKIEAVGSQSGTPSAKVVIVDSGELPLEKEEVSMIFYSDDIYPFRELLLLRKTKNCEE